MTIGGDYTYQNQPSYPTTVLDVTTPAGDGLPTVFSAWPPGPYGFMGAQYNFCISTPAELLNDPAAFSAATGAPPFFSTAVGGLCGPRAQGLNLATGGAPLGGAGYVGGPVPYTPGGVAGNPSGPSPRIYWNIANTDTGDIDKTYATGPSFARYTAWGAIDHARLRLLGSDGLQVDHRGARHRLEGGRGPRRPARVDPGSH